MLLLRQPAAARESFQASPMWVYHRASVAIRMNTTAIADRTPTMLRMI